MSVAERVLERFGVAIAEGYGLTEASPIVTSSAGLPPVFGPSGGCSTGVEVRLVDDDGGEALVGDAGEIWVKGPNVFAGYLDDPEATARVLTPDGWLRTGDIAVCDDDGRLYLVDRAKDLSSCRASTCSRPRSRRCWSAIPTSSTPAWSACPTPTPARPSGLRRAAARRVVDEDTLIDHARDHLARYKAPSKVLFVDELPRNANGKLVRRDLIG